MSEQPPPSKRIRLSKDDLRHIAKEDLIARYHLVFLVTFTPGKVLWALVCSSLTCQYCASLVCWLALLQCRPSGRVLVLLCVLGGGCVNLGVCGKLTSLCVSSLSADLRYSVCDCVCDCVWFPVVLQFTSRLPSHVLKASSHSYPWMSFSISRWLEQETYLNALEESLHHSDRQGDYVFKSIYLKAISHLFLNVYTVNGDNFGKFWYISAASFLRNH